MTADEMFTSVTRILPIGRQWPTLRLIGGASGVSLCTWRKLLVISGNLHDEISKNDLPVAYRSNLVVWEIRKEILASL